MQNLPLALQIGASTFHPKMDPVELDRILAESSPYQTNDQILDLFRAALPEGRSCAVEAVLWAVRAAIGSAGMPAATRTQLIDFINQLGREVDDLHAQMIDIIDQLGREVDVMHAGGK